MVRTGQIQIPYAGWHKGTATIGVNKVFPAGITVDALRLTVGGDCEVNTQMLIPSHIDAAMPVKMLLMVASAAGVATGVAQMELWGTGANSGSVVGVRAWIAGQAVNISAAGARVYLVTLRGMLPGVYGPGVYAQFQVWRRNAGNTLADDLDIQSAVLEYRILG